LDITNNNGFLTPERILGVLEILNEKLVNLKTVVFKYEEDHPTVDYNSIQESVNILLSSFRDAVNYGNTLATYNGRVNVTFDYKVNVGIGCDSQETVADYIAGLRNEFPNFQYSSNVEDFCYHFQNSNIVSENLQLNICIQFTN